MPDSLKTKGELIEFYSIITPDGEEYVLENYADRFLSSITGMGMPPIEYEMQRGTFQHGETNRGYFLQPRTLTLVHKRSMCSREAYWNARSDLINHLRQNRAASPNNRSVLRTILPDGNVRDLTVLIVTGPVFQARDTARWEEWRYNESLQFVAHDPLFFNPAAISVSANPSIEITNLAFPVTLGPGLGMLFSSGAVDDIFNITYTGTWTAYPTITITGPLTNITITNTTIGDKLVLTTVLDAGKTITISLVPGLKTIVDSDGTNLMNTLSTDSDLITFAIEPAPLAASGINAIRLQGSNGVQDASDITFSFNEKFVAI